MFTPAPGVDNDKSNPLRTRRSCAGASGNAMHVNAIGAVIAAVVVLFPELFLSATGPMSEFGRALWLVSTSQLGD